MLLRKWTSDIVPESFVFNSILVWIRLDRVPMELWTKSGLVFVASVVGKPITLDLAIKETRRLSYARVCVELDVDSPMPAEITVNLRRANFIVTINYEWKPHKCKLCCAFGHSGGKCPINVDKSFKQLEEGEIRSSSNRPSCQVEKEGDMEDFDLTISDADLVKPSMQGNWFTWNSKDSSFIDVVSSFWVRHESISPLVSLMRNLHNFKPALHRHFGGHIRCLNKETLQLRPSGWLLDWRKPLFVKSPGFDGWNLVIRPSFVVLFVVIWAAPISPKEVRRVLFSMDSGKALVHDGFSVGFFKCLWFLVEEDFCDVVLHFFETCYLPHGVNATAITLISKCCGVEHLEDL
ncbi:hypothetical protein E5676_scaffold313G002900 [Cucumis melo var. makuwa]|uniref:Uncharacterized protein n=1 Tax=Cucumis melo var. makuwa TaxID=1194695 RepID=A0A5D3DSV5_CUCMM|nr:hypothetical protein E5676_scaffold313G002900 [Cucumis melo var. makuwa]